ncbi:restriction endonuclease fold toxin-2 domain-containing protein [Streptomyces sp. NPDC056975]|uniref:restriction endonuclease fold toxin-2 domain-containing protein n=1 Tax=Streptomyces sp. NPDC056975 TaxID=3345985 RepID=UPI00363A7353
MPPDLKVIAEGMIKASMGMVDTVMPGTVQAAVALSTELARQHGMAGDDDAGREFAKVYKKASATTLDMIGHSAYIMGETGKGLMRNAREFMARESAVASAILQKQVDLTYTMGDPGQSCDQKFLGLGQELPQVIGETSAWDQYAPGGMSDRFRGSPEKLRDVAGSWRAGGKLMQRLLTDAQAYASTADKAHSGEAADAFHKYFANTVGFICPSDRTHEDDPLVANLVGACMQLAKACDRYADHVDDAKGKITQHKTDLFRVDMPWDSPMFGGNGYDGGLKDAVLSDPYIRDLGDVAHALDSAEGRVRLPGASPDRPGLPGIPFLPLPVPVPVPVVVASYPGQVPGIMPMGSGYDSTLNRDAMPPAPGTTQLLSTPDQAKFQNWVNTLPAGGFAGGGGPSNPDNMYQMRVAGYPEREVPLPAAATGKSGKGLMVDGMRRVDGYAIEAKHVRDPGKCATYRSIDRVNKTLGTPPKLDKNGAVKFDPHRDGMYRGDASELARYRAALADPRNDEIRGFEIITNDKPAAPYWQSMMAMSGVNGNARYVP